MQDVHSAIVMLAACLMSASAGCAGEAPADKGPSTDGDAVDSVACSGTDSRWPACDPAATRQTVSFVHVNDLHANYTPDPDLGHISPYATIRGFVDQVRSENPYTLFTNGGDDHEKGSVAEQLSRGYSTLAMTQAMEFDVRVIGNHDFAWGEEELLAFSKDPHAAVLASNTSYTGHAGTFGGVPFVSYRVGCLDIGFIGLVSRPWNEKNEQYDGPFMEGFETRHDYILRVAELVVRHRPEVDLLVMVSHLGEGEDLAVAESVSGIDAILGGHSHTVMAVEQRVGNTVVVQTGSSGTWIGRLDLDVDLATRQVVDRRWHLTLNLPGSLPVDEVVQGTARDVMRHWAEDGLTPRGHLLTGARERQIADITARAAVELLLADAALVDPGTVWTDWQAGPLNQQMMLDTYKIERQPAGTTGFNSFYLASIGGDRLMALAADPPAGWSGIFPDDPDPRQTYWLALQKHAAMNPADYLPAAGPIADPAPALEAWELLDRWALARTAGCLYIDTDQAIEGCLREGR